MGGCHQANHSAPQLSCGTPRVLEFVPTKLTSCRSRAPYPVGWPKKPADKSREVQETTTTCSLEVTEQRHESVNEAGNFSRVAIHRNIGQIGAGRAVKLGACRHHDCFF